MRGDNLSAVFPIHLITIVFFRIMGGGYHNSALALVVSYCKGKHWCRTHFSKILHHNPVCCQDRRRGIGEKGIVDSRIMGDRNTNALAGETLEQVIGQTLGSHTYGVYVHSVGTYSHGSSQPPGSKFQISVKSIN